MSGYRQSSFDPSAWEPQGPPARPYTAVQWVGLVLGSLGVAAFLLETAGRLGLVPRVFAQDSTWIVVLLGCTGMMLLNSRRAPVTPKYREKFKRRRLIAAAAAIAAAIVGATTVIIMNSQGA